MSYEDLTTTKIVATQCVACGRPLLDAQSVATGMGPTCRAKYNYTDSITEEAREEANKLIHKLGVLRQEDGEVDAIKETLKDLSEIEGVSHIVDLFRVALIAPKMHIHNINQWTQAITFGSISKSASQRARDAKWSFIQKVKKAGLGWNKKITLEDEEQWALCFKVKSKVQVFTMMKENLSGALGSASKGEFIVP